MCGQKRPNKLNESNMIGLANKGESLRLLVGFSEQKTKRTNFDNYVRRCLLNNTMAIWYHGNCELAHLVNVKDFCEMSGIL